MKLKIFPSEKGDCLLLTGSDGKQVLVDGGMAASFSDRVAAPLSKLTELDVVYVSHIDQDHISGVLRMMDDLIDWRVYDFQKSKGRNPRKPTSPLPPTPKQIWHNTFRETIGENAGEIEKLLVAQSAMLANSSDPAALELSMELQDLATSMREALLLTRRVSSDQMGIPHNPEYGGKLMMIKDGMPNSIGVGGMTFRVLAPFESDLKILRDEWDDWLKKNGKVIDKIRRDSKRDAEAIGNSVAMIDDWATSQADALQVALASGADNLGLAGGLGNRAKVTYENLTSLMFHVEEAGKTILLTGDGHSAEVMKGLKHQGLLNANGGIHVNVLKVPHHGSEHNIDQDFARQVTADHYVFCGNGEHENPDIRVLDAFLDSRLGASGVRSSNPEATQRFRFWFSCDADTAENQKNPHSQAHMRKVLQTVEARAGSKFSYRFLATTPLVLSL